MLIERTVRKIAKDLEIPMIGLISADPLTAHLSHLQQRAFTPFCHTKPEKRLDFRSVMPDVKTVVVIGLPYPLFFESNNTRESECGRLAGFCYGTDYHQRVQAKCEALAMKLLSLESFEYQVFVDNARLLDRAAAHKAGLGFYGKNNLLINPEYGSAFNIGLLLMNVPIEHKSVEPLESLCGNCTKCIESCPTNALAEGGQMDTPRCISYLTQKKKLSQAEVELVSRSEYLFGCDLCQLVCPYNAKLPIYKWEDPSGLNAATPNLKAMAAMDEKTYEQAFFGTALYWRGVSLLKRNADNRIGKKREPNPDLESLP